MQIKENPETKLTTKEKYRERIVANGSVICKSCGILDDLMKEKAFFYEYADLNGSEDREIFPS